MSNDKKPWEMRKSLVKVIEADDGCIIGENKKNYLIELNTSNGKKIKSKLPKQEFDDLPHPIKIGTGFWFVTYCTMNKEVEKHVWPVSEYWHKSRR